MTYTIRPVCTGRSTHPEVVFDYVVVDHDDGELVVEGRPEPGAPSIAYLPGRTTRRGRGKQPTRTFGHRVGRKRTTFHFTCPRCPADLKLGADTLDAVCIRLAEAGVSRLDISARVLT